MEGSFNNFIYIFFGLFALLFIIVIIEFISINGLKNRIKRQKRRYDRLLRGMDPDINMEEVLMGINKSINSVESRVSTMQDDLVLNSAESISAFVKTGVVHYDAFENQTGNLSFSICLLDKTNTGIVLTSLYGREFSNIYLKDVKNGEIDNASPEEISAVKRATKNN